MYTAGTNFVSLFVKLNDILVKVNIFGSTAKFYKIYFKLFIPFITEIQSKYLDNNLMVTLTQHDRMIPLVGFRWNSTCDHVTDQTRITGMVWVHYNIFILSQQYGSRWCTQMKITLSTWSDNKTKIEKKRLKEFFQHKQYFLRTRFQFKQKYENWESVKQTNRGQWNLNTLT